MYHRVLPHEFFEAGMFGNGKTIEEGGVGRTGALSSPGGGASKK